MTDYLDTDVLTVPGQLYALVSFVSPDGNQKNAQCGMKIRGCFSSAEEAQGHVRRLQKFDPTCDIYMVEMYKWVLVPPTPDMVENQEDQEEFLNNMMKEYKKSQEAARVSFEERKRAVMADGLDKHLLPHERVANASEDPGQGQGSSSSSSP